MDGEMEAGSEGDRYKYRGEPLQPAMAKPLILEVLRRAATPLERKQLAAEVVDLHRARGGGEPRQPPIRVIKKALGAMSRDGLVEAAGAKGRIVGGATAPIVESEQEEDGEDEIVDCAEAVVGQGVESVYVYFSKNDQKLAQHESRDFWECKIGFTSSVDIMRRIIDQGVRTAIAHPPGVGLRIRTDDARGLEEELHTHLREVGAEVDDSLGQEWFWTSPERVRRWYEARAQLIEILRVPLGRDNE